jgi:hypothetical protein
MVVSNKSSRDSKSTELSWERGHSGAASTWGVAMHSHDFNLLAIESYKLYCEVKLVTVIFAQKIIVTDNLTGRPPLTDQRPTRPRHDYITTRNVIAIGWPIIPTPLRSDQRLTNDLIRYLINNLWLKIFAFKNFFWAWILLSLLRLILLCICRVLLFIMHGVKPTMLLVF